MKIGYKIHEWESPLGSKYDCARVTIRAEYFFGEYYINRDNINSCLGCHKKVNYRRFGKQFIS